MMQIHLTSLFSIIVVFFIFIFLNSAYGQEKYSDSYSIETEGEIVTGSTITASLKNGSDSTQSIRSVDWYVGDAEQKKFKNKLYLELNVPNSPIFITANIIYFDIFDKRRSAQVTRIIQPILFDVLWEGDTAVTPGYRGHKLVGPDAPIVLSAHIEYINLFGTIFTEKDFSFRWLIDFKYSKEGGPGKYKIVIPEGIDYLSEYLNVRVEATLVNDTSITFTKNISVPVSQPVFLAYTHSPLYGLNTRRAIPKNSIIIKKPVTISLYPFYFSKKDLDADLIRYNWFVSNGKDVSKTGRRLDISVEGESVRIPFKVNIQNENNNLQRLTHTFSLSL